MHPTFTLVISTTASKRYQYSSVHGYSFLVFLVFVVVTLFSTGTWLRCKARLISMVVGSGFGF